MVGLRLLAHLAGIKEELAVGMGRGLFDSFFGGGFDFSVSGIGVGDFVTVDRK